MTDKLEVGLKLQAKFSDGAFYPATVVSISDSKKRAKAPVKVHFVGYEDSDDAWVSLDDLKSKRLPKDAGSAAAKAKSKAKPELDLSGLEKGMRVQAEADGTYYAADILTVSTAKNRAKAPVKVHYCGYTDASDEWVSADRLRSKNIKAKEADVNGKTEAKGKAAPAKKKETKSKPLDRIPTEFDPYLQNRVNAVTLTQYIIESTKQLAMLMNAIGHACKVVANSIEKAGPAGLYGLAGSANATGDDVKKLDIIADDIWCECLKRSGVCGLLVSEEQEQAIIIEDKATRGPFCVAFDPLDGSSNIDCNVSVGSIFSVYRRKSSEDAPCTDADILRPGTEIIVAGYCMYGAATELIITFGRGVQRFALDPALGEFLFVSDMKMDPKGGKKIFSCNEGNSLQWDPPILKYVEECKDNGYAARYVGSMVSDVHRTLLYGGIFLYPADKKSTKGKLRVLYEGFPMALITEQAGGVSSTGMFKGKLHRILEVMPEHIHDRNHGRCPRRECSAQALCVRGWACTVVGAGG
eukprot:CAMPEP_0115362150 /NCGR_PEP_ID=MMETSP0270-20121206/102561_1 /TAXON_ID=71861 /ORGANISM="Scrippsiella trochoidea, Strain CCMP3099" /LENGTH=523 /DNA_ID=CAMNT_0002784721 /DNA_START=89 /DNA_END=1656 /DNA_ORIENTATION=+